MLIFLFDNIVGLVLYKLLGYLTKMNKRKHMARQGLKQIGEHMNAVTRTMSADPTGMYFDNIFISSQFMY